MYGRLRTSARTAMCALFLSLSACSGGGGGGGGVPDFGGSSPTPAPPPEIASPSSFETTEFDDAVGLAQINAQYAYARGATGSGVTVAVVDTGVNFSHPDLAAQKDPDSTNVNSGLSSGDSHGHGTQVAGIIGAVKNDVGMHGVAYGAKILSVRADSCDYNASTCPGALFSDYDIATAIHYAIDNGARVINLSLAGPGGVSPQLFDALVRAGNEGVAVVAATGNAGGSQPEFPAALATYPTAGKTLIAVGAVDQTNVIASFSNLCGTRQSSCVVAPGVNVLTTDSSSSGYVYFSGTSAATPYAAGALAVLMSAWPYLSTADIIAILLNNTRDLGTAGADSVYGRGLIDLNLAIVPTGVVSVPTGLTTTDSGIAVTATTASLGPAFGDALLRYGAMLDRTLVVDEYGRAYSADLSRNIATRGRRIEWDGALAVNDLRTVDLEAPLGVAISVEARDPDRFRAADHPWMHFADEDVETRPEVNGISARWAMGRDLDLSLVHGLTADRLPGDLGAAADARALFLDAGETFAPYLGLTSIGTGGAARHFLSNDTSVRFGWFDSDGAAARGGLAGDAAPAPRAGMAYAGLSHHLGGGARLGLRYTHVNEDDRFLASRATGAFGEHAGAVSDFISATVAVPLTDSARFVAAYTEASARVDRDGYSMLSDWSDIRANAYAAGILVDDPLGAGGRIGLMVGQPLRVYAASATLTRPDSVNVDGTINYASDRVDLTPTGREIDVQLAYSAGLFDGGSIQGWLLGRLQPGHDRDAAPDYGAGVKVRIGF